VSQAIGQLNTLQAMLQRIRSTSNSSSSIIPNLSQATSQVNGLAGALQNMFGSLSGVAMGGGNLPQNFNNIQRSGSGLTNTLLGMSVIGSSLSNSFRAIGVNMASLRGSFKGFGTGVFEFGSALIQLGRSGLGINNLRNSVSLMCTSLQGLGTSGMLVFSQLTRGVVNLGFNIAKGLGIVAIGAVVALGASFIALGTKILTVGIKYNAFLETLKTGYDIMLAGGKGKTYGEEQSKALMKFQQEFANFSPFTMPQVAQGSVQLLQYGVGEDTKNGVTQVQALSSAVSMLGDVSRGIPDQFDRMAYAFGQVTAMGRLQGQELRQMINAGWNPLQEMVTKNKTMPQLKKDMEDGAISIDMVTKALIKATSEGGRFYGMMERQAKTLTGRWSTLIDKAQMFAGKATESLTGPLKNAMINITNMLDVLGTKGNLDYLSTSVNNNVIPALENLGKTLVWLTGIDITLGGNMKRPPTEPELKQQKIDYNSGKSKVKPGTAIPDEMGGVKTAIDNVTKGVGNIIKGITIFADWVKKTWNVCQIFFEGLVAGLTLIKMTLQSAALGAAFLATGFVTLAYGASTFVTNVVLGFEGLLEGLVRFASAVSKIIGETFDNMAIDAANGLKNSMPAGSLLPDLPRKDNMKKYVAEMAGAFGDDNVFFALKDKNNKALDDMITSNVGWYNKTSDALAGGIGKSWDQLNTSGENIKKLWKDIFTPVDTSKIDDMFAKFAKLTSGAIKPKVNPLDLLTGGKGGDDTDKLKKIADAAAKVAEAIQNITDKLVNMGNAFEKVTYEKFSPYKLQVRLKRFLTEMSDWTKNLAKLSKQGVPESMIQGLREMGMAGYGITKTLAKSTDAQRANIVKEYGQARDMSWSVASKQAKYEQKITNIYNNVTGNSVVSPQLVDILVDKITVKLRQSGA
jgi:tape measure domain-containing protein